MIMLNDHPKPAVDLEAVFAPKRAAREAGIRKHIESEARKGNTLDRLSAAVYWDAHKAPVSTNLRQLAEIGITLPDPQEVSDGDLPEVLRRTFDGLGILGVYFVHTNHLTDRELYVRLMTQVLNEDVRDIPPTPEMVEFIDLDPVLQAESVSWKDGTGVRKPQVSSRDSSLPRPEHFRAAD